MKQSSHLKLEQRDEIIDCFSRDLPALQTEGETKIHRNTVNRWYRIFRQLIWNSLEKKPRFKGEIEMDQGFYGKKRRPRKSKKKRAFKRGLNYGILVPEFRGKKVVEKREDDLMQVFVIAQRVKNPKMGQKKARIYVHPVRKGNRDTLIPIVHLIVAGKSTIYTDGHRVFDKLKESGYKHQVVLKGKKNPTGVHTASVDNFFSWSKARLRAFKGIPRHTIHLHIKECEWRYNLLKGPKFIEIALRNLLKIS